MWSYVFKGGRWMCFVVEEEENKFHEDCTANRSQMVTIVAKEDE